MKKSLDTGLKVSVKIHEKPAVFFKKLIPFWRDQMVYSKIIPDWLAREENGRLEELQSNCTTFERMQRMLAIVNCLETCYPDSKYDYVQDTYLSLAFKLRKKYEKRIEKYWKKKYNKNPKAYPNPYTAVEAFKELVYRGFVPKSLVKEEFDEKKHYFLQTTIMVGCHMIYPVKFKSQAETWDKLYELGVSGYTGLTQPIPNS